MQPDVGLGVPPVRLHVTGQSSHTVHGASAGFTHVPRKDLGVPSGVEAALEVALELPLQDLDLKGHRVRCHEALGGWGRKTRGRQAREERRVPWRRHPPMSGRRTSICTADAAVVASVLSTPGLVIVVRYADARSRSCSRCLCSPATSDLQRRASGTRFIGVFSSMSPSGTRPGRPSPRRGREVDRSINPCGCNAIAKRICRAEGSTDCPPAPGPGDFLAKGADSGPGDRADNTPQRGTLQQGPTGKGRAIRQAE